jgi:Ser/Thr protein kinase RdoA (MazF antagonist)
MKPLPGKFDFIEIVKQLRIPDDIASVMPLGEGHINDTFLIKSKGTSSQDYVLQRINHNIFRDVARMMENIHRIITHVNRKKNSTNNHEVGVPDLIKTTDDKLFLIHRGDYWRCYTYCNSAVEKPGIINDAKAFEGGRAIGKFQVMLADLPGGKLHDTIPDFHNLKVRLDNFHTAIKSDAAKRADGVKKLISDLLLMEDEMLLIYRLEREGIIPVRVTHNDTKFNNILFDDKDKAVCIIDLDTVMNGSILYDFGDAVRTLCNTTAEDEPDLSKVDFNLRLFDRFTAGYLSAVSTIITKVECEMLVKSCRLLTYLMAIRFLTDYLNGDTYYKTAYPGHNLARASNQYQLLSRLGSYTDQMEGCVRRYLRV